MTLAPNTHSVGVGGLLAGADDGGVWLNEKGLDIRCIRLRPHKLNDELVLQVNRFCRC